MSEACQIVFLRGEWERNRSLKAGNVTASLFFKDNIVFLVRLSSRFSINLVLAEAAIHVSPLLWGQMSMHMSPPPRPSAFVSPSDRLHNGDPPQNVESPIGSYPLPSKKWPCLHESRTLATCLYTKVLAWFPLTAELVPTLEFERDRRSSISVRFLAYFDRNVPLARTPATTQQDPKRMTSVPPTRVQRRSRRGGCSWHQA